MTERELTRVMTGYVADVHLPDEAVRRIRMAAKEDKPVKKKMSLALALMMTLMLLAGAAVAAEMGIFDFLNRMMGQEVLPEAERIVQSDVAVAETEYATFHVRQAAYDGQSALIMVEAVPAGDAFLLLEETACPEEDLIAQLIPEMAGSTQTVGEYAAENGLTMIVATMRQSYLADSMEIVDWNEGKLTLMKSFHAESEAFPMTLTFNTFPYERTVSYDEAVSTKQVELNLTTAAPLWQVSSEQSFELPEYGIRIDGVTVTGTALQSYWQVRYTVTDLEKVQDGGFRVEVLDAQGNALPRGVLGGGGSGLAQHEGDELIWHSGFGAMTEAPAQLMLQVRDVSGALAPVQMIFDLR